MLTAVINYPNYPKYPNFSLFTPHSITNTDDTEILHSFTFHFSLFTLHFSLFTLHFFNISSRDF